MHGSLHSTSLLLQEHPVLDSPEKQLFIIDTRREKLGRKGVCQGGVAQYYMTGLLPPALGFAQDGNQFSLLNPSLSFVSVANNQPPTSVYMHVKWLTLCCNLLHVTDYK